MRCRDGLHPTVAGYKRIAAHLFYASCGLNLETSHRYDETYSGDFGSVRVTYCKVGSNVSFSVFGTINPGFNGMVPIGTRPTWMSMAYDTVLPVWGSTPNTALCFSGGGVFVWIYEHTEAVTINGGIMFSLDML